MVTNLTPSERKGSLRPKMGDLEAILAQAPSAAAFGEDKGYKLILHSLYLKWLRSMVTIIGSISLVICPTEEWWA